MRVLFVTPECAPYAKTGGLGDVSAALPAALRRIGLDVRVLVPGYPSVLEGIAGLRLEPAADALGLQARVLANESFFVLDCPPLYRREGGPYQSPDGADWPDNALRFGMLCRAAATVARAWGADVVHCNDWQSGLVPMLLERPSASLMTVHNLAFQGNFEPAWVNRLGLPPECFTMAGAEFYGRLSFLKAGLAWAGAISTVSPTYAREIQTPAHGCGMDGLLRQRAGALSGILNGIDTEEWDPAKDRHIAAPYDARSLERKALNKADLQRRLGLEPRADVPLFGFVGRLTGQKGADLVAAAAAELLALPAQLALLGTGMRQLEEALLALAARFPGAMAARIGFDEALAHAIEAGADFFLMPSRFEPCGLNQMYSQRYGTPPIARATGGLADTVVDGETGFLFDDAEPAALIAAARRAAALWRDEPRRLAMRRAGMARDFGWGGAARRYAGLYARLAVDRPAAVP